MATSTNPTAPILIMEQPGEKPPQLPPRPSSTHSSPAISTTRASFSSTLTLLDLSHSNASGLEVINQRLSRLIAELTEYNQNISNLQNSIDNYSNQDDANYHLENLHQRNGVLQSSLKSIQTKFEQIQKDFTREDAESGYSWSGSSNWEPYESYQKHKEELSSILAKVLPCKFPAHYLDCMQEQINQLQKELQIKNNLMSANIAPRPKDCCVIA